MVLSQALIDQPDVPVLLPTDIESVEPQLETYRHLKQLLLLLACLEWVWADRNDFFAAGNLTVYFSEHQLLNQDFRGPDFLVVLDTERKDRKSWVVWAEGGKYPNLILEVLSDSTEKTDRTTKKQIYQDIFRTPDYFWFHPYKQEFKGFRLVNGHYQAIQPNDRGWLWSEELQFFLGVFNEYVRFFTPDGQLVPTPEEAEAQQRQRADEEQQRADEEQQRAEAQRQRADEEQQRANETEAQLALERQRSQQLRQKLQDLGVNLED
jgi:Uma2 family endonuclease